ncbi:hypothetical protein WH221_16845 [Chryseobacterium culicis]|uniref:Uncharacterized protein n=1 Tax=Chryseobacterium culicis TaxID=680127 RepID=A0A2S9CPD8_CHRCI|nr:hypothetical protein [Chryseobacterium culicis]PRB82355.1 hypothetical protein CQ022_16805 [Chryseobacterium culicis]PRB88730.1 hypothetical protein CQ033_15700 [Chryseobacterium culicis]
MTTIKSIECSKDFATQAGFNASWGGSASPRYMLNTAANYATHSSKPKTIPRIKQLMTEGDIVVIYGVKDKYHIKGTFEDSTIGHCFVGLKKGGELHLFDGQTGEYVIYTNNDKARNFLQRGYPKRRVHFKNFGM